jgi:hypothetical protein
MRARVIGVSIAAAGLMITGFFFASPRSNAAQPNDDESKIQIGFAISPVPLNLKGKNRALVGMGSYLVNAVGGCNDCHTWRVIDAQAGTGSNYEVGGDPFLGQPEAIYTEGYLGGGRPFGPFASRNITPDASGQVADGYESFRNIIRHGVDPDNFITPLLQVMPWPVYRNMSENDLKAIYEYLTSIPCVEGTPGEPTNNTNRCGN